MRRSRGCESMRTLKPVDGKLCAPPNKLVSYIALMTHQFTLCCQKSLNSLQVDIMQCIKEPPHQFCDLWKKTKMFQQILRAVWSLQACRLSDRWWLGQVGRMGKVIITIMTMITMMNIFIMMTRFIMMMTLTIIMIMKMMIQIKNFSNKKCKKGAPRTVSTTRHHPRQQRRLEQDDGNMLSVLSLSIVN